MQIQMWVFSYVERLLRRIHFEENDTQYLDNPCANVYMLVTSGQVQLMCTQ